MVTKGYRKGVYERVTTGTILPNEAGQLMANRSGDMIRRPQLAGTQAGILGCTTAKEQFFCRIA
jgi:hypothetical protein